MEHSLWCPAFKKKFTFPEGTKMNFYITAYEPDTKQYKTLVRMIEAMGGQVTTDAAISAKKIISLTECPRIPLPPGVITEDYIYANYIYDRFLDHRFDMDIWMDLGRSYRIHRERWHLPLEQQFNIKLVIDNSSPEPIVNENIQTTITSTTDIVPTQKPKFFKIDNKYRYEKYS